MRVKSILVHAVCLWTDGMQWRRGPTSFTAEVDRPGIKTIGKLYADTLRISGFLRHLLHGHLVEMWKCQWERRKRDDPAVRQFLADHFGVLPLQGKKTVSTLDMREALTRTENPVFGFVEVRIDDVVPLTKTYAEERGELKRPCRLLVVGRKAQKVLLITPLFRWYIKRRHVVTKIY